MTSRPPTAPAAPPQRAHGRSPFVVLGIALLGISLAAPLVRLSSSPALVIAAWRLAFSMIIVGIALLLTGEWRAWRVLRLPDHLLAGAAGVLLALHFWSWNASLRYTTVAASVALVNLQPVIIALISAWWLQERPSRRQWAGIWLAMTGALVVGLVDVPGGIAGIGRELLGGDASATGDTRSRALLGDGLAVLGAITASLYYLIGRRLRQHLALWAYVGLVYGAALVACVVLAAATGASLTALGSVPQRELAIFAGLALGPMLLGHTGMNWALGHLPAYVVNLTVMGEPIGATLLAALLPGINEVPGVGTVIGGVCVLAGVVLAARR